MSMDGNRYFREIATGVRDWIANWVTKMAMDGGQLYTAVERDPSGKLAKNVHKFLATRMGSDDEKASQFWILLNNFILYANDIIHIKFPSLRLEANSVIVDFLAMDEVAVVANKHGIDQSNVISILESIVDFKRQHAPLFGNVKL